MNLDKQTIKNLDPQGMQDLILGFPEQLETALQICKTTPIAVDGTRIKNICVMGMGGSAIGGDLVRCFLYKSLKVPMLVNRFYEAPGFIDNGSLVLISSYSGNTEETISAYRDALAKGAQVVCTSSGGEVSRLANENQHTLFKIPGGAPPRSALGLLTVPIIYTLHASGFIDDPTAAVQEVIAVTRLLRDELNADITDNPAKQIAEKLLGKIPLIYSAVLPMEAAAMRWKGQLSENSKVMAFCNVFPELNHNEIVGWGPLQKISQLLQVIYLRDRDDHDRVDRRMEITRSVIEKHTGNVIQIASRGDSLLARMFSLIYFGDLVSLYLAALNKVNPTSIDNIDYLKTELAS